MSMTDGARRTPCPRTLLAHSTTSAVELSDCGTREVHVGGVMLRFDADGFRDFCRVLEEASSRLASGASLRDRFGFAAVAPGDG